MEKEKTTQLKVLRKDDNGFLLFDGVENEYFLPADEVPDTLEEGDNIEVFTYRDSEGKLLATTKYKKSEKGKFAYLKVKVITKVGAFIETDDGEDILLPFSEKSGRVEEEYWYLFYLMTDAKTGRMIASRRLNDHMVFDDIDVKEGDVVDLLLYQRTDLGMNALVNEQYKGLIFFSDIHQNINLGDRIKGYVKQVRNDGRIDIVLTPVGYRKSIDKISETILNALDRNDGFLELTDKSSPDDIRHELGLSKKAFKKALGNLYKQKIVALYKDGIKKL